MLKRFIVAIGLMSAVFLPAMAVQAQTADQIICDQLRNSSNQQLNCEAGDSTSLVNRTIDRVVGLLTFLVGTVAVIIIVIAGLMYVFSGGNPQNTARAKDAIIYAVIGLVVAVIARLVVSFVLSRVG